MSRPKQEDVSQLIQQIQALLLSTEGHRRGESRSLMATKSTTQQATIWTDGGEDELLVTLIVS